MVKFYFIFLLKFIIIKIKYVLINNFNTKYDFYKGSYECQLNTTSID